MNYQTSNTGDGIDAHIGALELGAINLVDDGALEAAVHVGPGLTIMPCTRVADRALEQAAARAEVGPTNKFVANRCM